MRSITRFSKGLVALLLIGGAGLGLGACGPDYAVFKVHVSAATPRDDIENCRMSIVDENGKAVIHNVPLLLVAGAAGDPNQQGCSGGLTPANVGYFSYSSSRSSGTLTFTVEATNSNEVVVESATASQGIRAYPPEIPVELGMTRQ